MSIEEELEAVRLRIRMVEAKYDETLSRIERYRDMRANAIRAHETSDYIDDPKAYSDYIMWGKEVARLSMYSEKLDARLIHLETEAHRLSTALKAEKMRGSKERIAARKTLRRG